jgi:hypothetical protein
VELDSSIGATGAALSQGSVLEADGLSIGGSNK